MGYAAEILRNSTVRKLLVVTTFFLLIIFWIYIEKRLGPNANDAKLKELEALLPTLPLYPGMVETDSHITSKASVASISKDYKCEAAYQAIKEFYLGKVRAMGWQYLGERHYKDWGKDLGGREFAFQKDQYRISVFYFGEDSPTPARYSVGIEWEQP